MLFKPSTEPSLNHTKIDNTPQRIQFFALNPKIDAVIVAMQGRAARLVLVYTMTAANIMVALNNNHSLWRMVN